MSYYNEQMERAVLGEMMDRNHMIEEVSENDFDHAKHRDLFREIKRRSEAGDPFTIVDLRDFGFSLFNSYEHGTMTTDSSNFFIPSMTIRELKKLTEKRDLDRVFQRASTTLASAGVDEAIQSVESGLLEVANNTCASDISEAKDEVLPALASIEEIYNRRGGLSGISTSFAGLNAMTDGWQNSDYVIIAARPSVGKTALANQFIIDACRVGKKVGFFSAEMPKGKIMQRILCSISGVSIQDVRSARLSPAKFHDFNRAAEEISEFGLYIDDTPNIEISRLRVQAKRMLREKKIDMLVVDYLGLISSKEHARTSIYERITAISRLLKQLSRELKIPVIVLAQINRDADGKQPTMANLRDSGAIEQDADMIIILHRRSEHENSAMDLILEKHRNGPTGSISIAFDQPLQRFNEFVEPA